MNKVILIGRLTKEPELKQTTSGIAVTTFTLAVNRNFTNRDGEREADFIQCVAWKKQAENIAKYLNKGSQVAVDGRIQVRTYDDMDGKRNWITEVMCDSVQFLDTKTQKEDTEKAEKESDPFADFGKAIAEDLPF